MLDCSTPARGSVAAAVIALVAAAARLMWPENTVFAAALFVLAAMALWFLVCDLIVESNRGKEMQPSTKAHIVWAGIVCIAIVAAWAIGRMTMSVNVAAASATPCPTPPPGRRVAEEARKAAIVAAQRACGHDCKPPFVRIFFKRDDGETAVLANDLRTIFERLHWPVDGPTAWTYTDQMSGWGVWLETMSDARLEERDVAGELVRALADAVAITPDAAGDGYPCDRAWNVYVNEDSPRRADATSARP